MKRTLLVLAILALALAHACGADPLTLAETDAVVTLKAEGASFSGYTKYFMPAGIVDLCLQPEQGTPTIEGLGGAGGAAALDPSNCYITDHSTDEAVLAAIKGNMAALQYELVESETEADLVLLVALIARSSWWLSRDYCYPSEYYGVCIDQSSSPEVIVPSGSILLQLIDPALVRGDEVTSLWTAAIHKQQAIAQELGTGLGGGTTGTKAQILTGALNEAFDQSPYLAEGGK